MLYLSHEFVVRMPWFGRAGSTGKAERSNAKGQNVEMRDRGFEGAGIEGPETAVIVYGYIEVLYRSWWWLAAAYAAAGDAGRMGQRGTSRPASRPVEVKQTCRFSGQPDAPAGDHATHVQRIIDSN